MQYLPSSFRTHLACMTLCPRMIFPTGAPTGLAVNISRGNDIDSHWDAYIAKTRASPPSHHQRRQTPSASKNHNPAPCWRLILAIMPKI